MGATLATALSEPEWRRSEPSGNDRVKVVSQRANQGPVDFLSSLHAFGQEYLPDRFWRRSKPTMTCPGKRRRVVELKAFGDLREGAGGLPQIIRRKPAADIVQYGIETCVFGSQAPLQSSHRYAKFSCYLRLVDRFGTDHARNNSSHVECGAGCSRTAEFAGSAANVR